MEYTEVNIKLKKHNPFADILVARLNEIGFESYAEYHNGIKAYIQTQFLNKTSVKEVVSDISVLTDLSCTIRKVKQENWNVKWESNFQPVHINKKCVIRAHFHKSFPDVEFEIIITPKMSFGTGHHETTALIMNEMFKLDFQGRSVLDIGSGTGILAILASKIGAVNLIGIDSDQWAFKNSLENSNLNNIKNIKFIHGDVDKIQNMTFDIILVNINRNVILKDIEKYVDAMDDAASILLSGFLSKDTPLILEKTEQLGLQLVVLKNNKKWQMLHLKKG